ncbi:MAG: BrnT family toxin [Chloroflexota bacterium]|nr:BrnT family toxin [Chloroflexota bacterium]
MRIDDCIWLDDIVEKLASKHDVLTSEIEQVLADRPHFRYVSKGRHTRNEDVYAAYGQTEAGRYLTIFFIYKPGNLALIISARDMDNKERKQYGKHRIS